MSSSSGAGGLENSSDPTIAHGSTFPIGEGAAHFGGRGAPLSFVGEAEIDLPGKGGGGSGAGGTGGASGKGGIGGDEATELDPKEQAHFYLLNSAGEAREITDVEERDVKAVSRCFNKLMEKAVTAGVLTEEEAEKGSFSLGQNSFRIMRGGESTLLSMDELDADEQTKGELRELVGKMSAATQTIMKHSIGGVKIRPSSLRSGLGAKDSVTAAMSQFNGASDFVEQYGKDLLGKEKDVTRWPLIIRRLAFLERYPKVLSKKIHARIEQLKEHAKKTKTAVPTKTIEQLEALREALNDKQHVDPLSLYWSAGFFEDCQVDEDALEKAVDKRLAAEAQEKFDAYRQSPDQVAAERAKIEQQQQQIDAYIAQLPDLAVDAPEEDVKQREQVVNNLNARKAQNTHVLAEMGAQSADEMKALLETDPLQNLRKPQIDAIEDELKEIDSDLAANKAELVTAEQELKEAKDKLADLEKDKDLAKLRKDLQKADPAGQPAIQTQIDAKEEAIQNQRDLVQEKQDEKDEIVEEMQKLAKDKLDLQRELAVLEKQSLGRAGEIEEEEREKLLVKPREKAGEDAQKRFEQKMLDAKNAERWFFSRWMGGPPELGEHDQAYLEHVGEMFHRTDKIDHPDGRKVLLTTVGEEMLRNHMDAANDADVFPEEFIRHEKSTDFHRIFPHFPGGGRMIRELQAIEAAALSETVASIKEWENENPTGNPEKEGWDLMSVVQTSLKTMKPEAIPLQQAKIPTDDTLRKNWIRGTYVQLAKKYLDGKFGTDNQLKVSEGRVDRLAQLAQEEAEEGSETGSEAGDDQSDTGSDAGGP